MRKINKKETFQNVKLSLFSYKGISVLMLKKKKTMVMTNDDLVSFVFKYTCGKMKMLANKCQSSTLNNNSVSGVKGEEALGGISVCTGQG